MGKEVQPRYARPSDGQPVITSAVHLRGQHTSTQPQAPAASLDNGVSQGAAVDSRVFPSRRETILTLLSQDDLARETPHQAVVRFRVVFFRIISKKKIARC